MTILHMLDTDITSYIIRDKSPLIAEKLAEIEPSMVGISVITRAELLYGLKKLPINHGLHLIVRQFLRIIRIFSWDMEAADHYADIRHQLVSTGQPIGEMDMMIAAHALALGAILVTNNTRHYERIDGPIMIKNWVY